MTSKKLGALLRSVPPATARTTPEPVPPVPNEQPRRMPIAKEEPEVPLQVLVPARIREELGILGARERQSLRALILRAVRSLGIEVSEEEVEGKRGRRRRRR
jgi:hypothetical protein